MIQVMIVEDDPMVMEINTRFLEKVEGFNLVKAVNCLTQAKKCVISEKPDLILLDIYLPRENGVDLIKWLREEELLVDVIFITADKSSIRIQEAFRYGAVDYLIKPFTFERFKESLLQFKERYYRLNNLRSLEQSELDVYISKNTQYSQEKISDNTELIKGFNKYTYRKIWSQMQKTLNEFTTAEELSEKIGIARVTVRKYLDYMDKEGKVKKTIEYGKIGRPQHKYSIK